MYVLEKFFWNSAFSPQNHNSIVKTMQCYPDAAHKASQWPGVSRTCLGPRSSSLSECSHTEPFLKLMLCTVAIKKSLQPIKLTDYNILGFVHPKDVLVFCFCVDLWGFWRPTFSVPYSCLGSFVHMLVWEALLSLSSRAVPVNIRFQNAEFREVCGRLSPVPCGGSGRCVMLSRRARHHCAPHPERERAPEAGFYG